MTEVELTIMELLEAHPKSLAIVTEYFTNMMIESFNDEAVPEEFKELIRGNGITKERLALIIGGAPRCLFDVFDSHEIYIEIYRTSGNAFTFDIAELVDHPDHYNKRKECELQSIKEAFRLLESKHQIQS